jgi:putative membrane protein
VPTAAKQFLKRWAATTLGVLVAAAVVPGLRYDNAVTLLVASLLLGFLNGFVRPVLLLLSLPVLLATFGLFTFVINALLLWCVGSLVKGFHVDGFWSAFWGAIIAGIVSWMAGFFLGGDNARTVRRSKVTPGGDGPVIDV